MNLFDLTNQPQGVILGEEFDYPLFSIEQYNTFQYDATNQIILRNSATGVETIKYFTDLTSTQPNGIYLLTFDILLLINPDNLNVESKIEFQHGIDGDTGSTFFELTYDELKNLNYGGNGEYTTFTAEYIAPIGAQSILQIKAEEVPFKLKNTQVESQGIDDGGLDVLIDDGEQSDLIYIRACLCDSDSDVAYGSFKDDFINWEQNVYDDPGAGGEGFALYPYFTDIIPDGMYPTNCIGSLYAESDIQNTYGDGIDLDVSIYHDPQLCIFGGMELNPDKENLIGLTWSDFVQAIDEKEIFGLTSPINEVEFEFIYFNKNGDAELLDDDSFPSEYDEALFNNSSTLIYNFNAQAATEYYPPMIHNSTGENDEYVGRWPYKSFSYTYNPNAYSEVTGYTDIPEINGQIVPSPPTWEGEKYTTSENIYPVYGYDIGSSPIEEQEDGNVNIPVIFNGENWYDDELTFNDGTFEPHEAVLAGKCPPQFVGEQDSSGKFGRQTLTGFGPTMCHNLHFDKILEDWLEDDDIENPKIKPSNPSGLSGEQIETNPDDGNIEFSVFANFPNNDTFNFIKEKFDIKMIELFGVSPYTKYVEVLLDNDQAALFSSVSFQGIGQEIQEIDLTSIGNNDVLAKFNVNDVVPESGNFTINGDIFTEKYGTIIFTPNNTNVETQANIQYRVTHEFLPNKEEIFKINYKGLGSDNNYPSGYDGVKYYNYGNGFEGTGLPQYDEGFQDSRWWNIHYFQLWSIIGPGSPNEGEDFPNLEDKYITQRYFTDYSNGSTSEMSDFLYPNFYWAYEYDEQRGIQPPTPSDAYPNAWHWTNHYDLYDRDAESQKVYSYWHYDNPELSINQNIDLNILQLYDYSFAGDSTVTVDGIEYGGTQQNAEVKSHNPWPEQIIEDYRSEFIHNDGLKENQLLSKFDGTFGLPFVQQIYITGTVQFGGDFGVPGFDVDLNPSLDSSYDPYSGIDVRTELIDENICQHIELMTVQDVGAGDGLFYEASEHPLANSNELNITCETILNFNLYPFSKMRARCSDGSTILIADTNDGDTLEYPQQFFHRSGIDACTYASNNIRSYPNNKQFHFGVDLDKRPSLGLFYYEEDNQASENFIGDLGQEFEQYSNRNLVENGSGFLVESYDTWFLDNNQDDSYYPQSWGFRATDETSTSIANADAGGPAWLWDNEVEPELIDVAHPRVVSTVDNIGYVEQGAEDYYLEQFIQDDEYNSSIGYYRYAGYESYKGGFYEYSEPKNRGKNPRWIFEQKPYEYKVDVEFWTHESKAKIYINNKSVTNNDCPDGIEYKSCRNIGGMGECGFEMPEIEIYYSDIMGKGFDLSSATAARDEAWADARSQTVERFNSENDGLFDDDYDAYDDDNGCVITTGYINYSDDYQLNQVDYDTGTHPKCHSNGTCLNFNANQTLLNESNDNPYKHLTQWQQILTTEQATELFYHDIQSTPDLKVSFWMYTDSNKVDDVQNPTFPDVEVSVVKGNPYNATWRYHPKAYLSSISNNDQIAGSGKFKNTVLDEWEKFEFSFNLNYARFYNQDTRNFKPLYLMAQYSGVEVLDINGDTAAERYKITPGNVYLDDFSVKETGEFIPDVDVRAKKSEGVYGVGSLTEYHDPMIENQLEAYNDTTAPLEAQFYFYPRFFNEQVFDREDGLKGRFGSEGTFASEIIGNDFRRGRFYLYDVNWGDDTPNEFTDEPLRIGSDVAVYHTYTKSGIYEVSGYMLRTRPTKNQDGTPNHDEPAGVLHNKKFTVRINVNEGLDEDFTYFGSEDGFSYIPYKNISPIIGGISKESSYYKGIKRQLGFISDEINTSIYFEKNSDKLKTEIALSKMDSSFNNMFEILPEFQIPRYSEPPPTDGSEQEGELIYGGITSIEDELGKSLGNVDLTNVRFFNEPKEIYQMFGFTCDNNSDLDLIPLGKPDYGLNYSNHSRTFTDVDDIQSPYFTNVSKVANQTENGSIITDQNAIRFGHDFRIDNIEGLGVGQWNHIDGAFVDTLTFNTPDLGYNQTYTYSTHIYIPFGYCEDGRPCSAANNDYTVMCSECNGVQQYDEGSDFNVRIVQNMNDPLIGVNDWVHDLWLDDIVGGEWANQHNIGFTFASDEATFKYRQFDAFNHCHPKGVNNQRFKYGWSNGVEFPIRDGQHCFGLDYSACGLINPSGDADGCYWDGDENSGICMAANLYQNNIPANVSCWTATSEEQCEDGCEWYGDGSNNSNFETPITIPHEQIITDEWFRLDFPFTTKEPSEFGNHISLRFDTHLGVNRTSLDYQLNSGDLVTNGTFNDPPNDLSDEYLATLSFPSCFEEFDINQSGTLSNLDGIAFNDMGRTDIQLQIAELTLLGNLTDEQISAAGGYCPNGYDGINYEDFRNLTIGDFVLLDWNLFGDVVYSNSRVKILFGDSLAEVTQQHEYDSTTNGKIYKLKYKVIESTTEEESKLFIVANPAGYVVGESIELPTNTNGPQEVVFTSDSNFSVGGGEFQDATHPRTLIIGHSGGYNDNDFVVIDDVELYEVGETEVHTTTPNDGLYTFGAQLLVGDFSSETNLDLNIPYTTEDLNPGDCANFESGNPSNPRYWKNIIPKFYQFYYRDGLSDYDPDGKGNLFPTPSLPDGSDVWVTEFADVEVNYESSEDKLTVRVIDGDNQNNQGDGEKLPIRNKFVGILDHITQDSGCDGWYSCLTFMASQTDNLAAWYQLKFTYYGTETDVGGQSSNSLGGIGIGFGRMIYLRADDWDKETEGPMDGTRITSESGHPGELWIYGGDYDGDTGDGDNDYPNQPHPDFWENANCVVGEECTVWIMWEGGSPDYGNFPTEAGISLYNGQNYDETTWGGFSLIRGDEAVGLTFDSGLSFQSNYSSEQEWIGTNEYGNTYYYPVLPRFGFNGTFESANNQFYPGGNYDYPNDNIPFPIEGLVTEENPQEQSILFNIYNEQDETNIFKDGSGNDNNAFVISDYKPKYEEETSEPQSIKNVDRLKTSKDKGAF